MLFLNFFPVLINISFWYLLLSTMTHDIINKLLCEDSKVKEQVDHEKVKLMKQAEEVLKNKALEKQAANNAIITHYSGSLAYGTNTEHSDVDIRGVFVAEEKYRTPYFKIGEVEFRDEEDTKLYELHKFINYCSRCNPTYLETLFVDDAHIINSTPAYQYLRKNRDLFLSKAVASAYLEFADGQLKRINGHDKWISKPQPIERPQMVDFTKLINNFTDNKVFGRDFNLRDYKGKGNLVHYGNNIYGLFVEDNKNPFRPDGSLEKSTKSSGNKKLPPDFLIKFNQKEHERACTDWKNYWTWRENRNEVRAELEELYGFDTKHGAHVVRLLRMALEIIETGKVNVWRADDAEELKAIRFDGIWTLDDIKEYMKEMRAKIEKAVETSPLKDAASIDQMAQLCIDAEKMHHQFIKESNLNMSDEGFTP